LKFAFDCACIKNVFSGHIEILSKLTGGLQ
jgi:hypothetical protein